MQHSLHSVSIGHYLVEFLLLSHCQRTPSSRRRYIGAEPDQQELCFSDAEAAPLRVFDHRESIEHTSIVLAPAAGPRLRRNQADLLIIPERGRSQPCSTRHLADGQSLQPLPP